MSKYKAILTTAGAAKIAAASAGGKPLKIDRLAVGDGNGKLPTPSPAQTKLINERYRAALNSLTVDKAAPDRLIAELIIPASVGGFWLREMGLYDADGVLIAVSNMAESYKPKLEEGSGRTQTLRMVLIVSHTEAITLIVSGDMVTATRDFVTAAIDDHAKSRNHPDASTSAKGFVQLSSVTNSASETLAATPKAVKAVNDAAVKLTQNLADLPDKAKARASLGLKAAALRDVGSTTGQLMEVGAFGIGGFATGSSWNTALTGGRGMFLAGGDGAPTGSVYMGVNIPHSTLVDYAFQIASRKDFGFHYRTLDAGVPGGWVRVYDTKNKPTAADVGALTDDQALQKYALRSIKVNGKPLSADVNLLAGDVNAWNKSEADGRYLMLSGGTVKKLTVKTGSTGTENIAMLIDGVEHTPFVLKRSTATANLSIGFQLGGGAPLYRLGINDKNNLCWGTEANQAVNATIYHTKNKPTAADVGALTDAQALQKYALRSIKVNGKPISTDVNLQAGDVNAWNKTESDGRYFPMTGGNLRGQLNAVNGNVATQGGAFLIRNANGVQIASVSASNAGSVTVYSDVTKQGFGLDGGAFSTFLNTPIYEAGQRVYSPNNPPPNTTQISVSGDGWWYRDLRTGMIFQGGFVSGSANGGGAIDRVALNIAVPNRLLHVSITVRNFAQGFQTTWNPQTRNLAVERNAFDWIHGPDEREIYWMAIGY